MVAVEPSDPAPTAATLVDLGAGAVEPSTLDPALYGTPLSMGTLARATELRAAVPVPLVVPTQHRLELDDARALAGLTVAVTAGGVSRRALTTGRRAGWTYGDR